VHRAALVSMACVALAGCGGGAMPMVGVGSGSDASQGEASIRAAIPALEAYYADHGTYAGATVEKLRSLYDQSIEGVRIVSANDRTYCMENTGGALVFNKRGPAADIVDGPC
jgi:hypothetical protein